MKNVLIVVGWLVCATLTYGGLGGYISDTARYRYIYGEGKQTAGFHMMIALVGGPAATIVSFFLTGFYSHGFYFYMNDPWLHDPRFTGLCGKDVSPKYIGDTC